ncbi:MAG: divalent cation tolerance protein CutA [Acidobacteria bacterium]|nr:divalent cation tolerance protein CutA [Acidobacteriota bacterium]
MPFCPKCLSEYKTTITYCKDCDLDLVEELTDENRIHDISQAEMVELRTFPNAAEAEMIRGVLEQNDIRSLLQGETSSAGLFPAATSVSLLVDERDLEPARELVQAYLEAEVVVEDSEIGQPEEKEKYEIERLELAERPKQTTAMVVLITVDKKELADKLAETLVTENLAACVNILPQIESIYRWEGKVCRESELLLIAKTDMACYLRLEARVKELHTYTTPEVIALPITQGSVSYLSWLRNSLNL